VEDLTHLVL